MSSTAQARERDAERVAGIPFDASLLDEAPSDRWVFVSPDSRPLATAHLPAFSSGAHSPSLYIPGGRSAITAADLERLARGRGGHLFPFWFHSRYVKLAELALRVDRAGPIPEQVLFWLIEAGARTGALGSPPRGGRTAPLPPSLTRRVAITAHLLYGFSSALPGIAADRAPCRFSYKALFWESDDGATLHKLYRDPDRQPRVPVERNPAFFGGLRYAVRYERVATHHSPLGTRHLWLSMENLSRHRVLSDCAGALRRNAVGPVLDAFTESWLDILDAGLVPTDLSLSNALLGDDPDPVLVDLEEACDTVELLAAREVRPMLCWLAILHGLVTGEALGAVRFDDYRDQHFVPRWARSADGRWAIERRGEAHPFDSYEALVNARTPGELRSASEELRDHAARAV